MEENKKQEQRPQYFYFNEDGKLVVESNKGIIVDSEQTVKLYGNFVCNNKVMAQIMAIVHGKVFSFEGANLGYVCVDDTETARQLSEWSKKSEEIAGKITAEMKERATWGTELRDKVERFNSLPWYKRIFKQIEL